MFFELYVKEVLRLKLISKASMRDTCCRNIICKKITSVAVFFIVMIIFSNTLNAKEIFCSTWWENEVVMSSGYGIAPSQSQNLGQSKMISRRLAVMDGYRNLAKLVAEIHITADEKIVTEKIDAVIRGASILSEEYDESGNCSVILSVPVYGVTNSLAKAVFQRVEKKDFPSPSKNSSYEITSIEGNYTGLIIDCGDMELNPVLTPSIQDSKNQSIYSYSNLDYDKVVSAGMIGYAEKKSFGISSKVENNFLMLSNFSFKNNFAQIGSNIIILNSSSTYSSRAGNNPLIIKAESLNYDNSCPVISESDADKILTENQISHFLDEGSVVFTSNRIRGTRF